MILKLFYQEEISQLKTIDSELIRSQSFFQSAPPDADDDLDKLMDQSEELKEKFPSLRAPMPNDPMPPQLDEPVQLAKKVGGSRVSKKMKILKKRSKDGVPIQSWKGSVDPVDIMRPGSSKDTSSTSQSQKASQSQISLTKIEKANQSTPVKGVAVISEAIDLEEYREEIGKFKNKF